MITDETRPEDFENQAGKRPDPRQIKGWGIDADPDNDPTYPIKKRTDEEQLGYVWERPAQQQSPTEILKSVERPNRSAVFGTSSPPKGLSGLLRRIAYKYSESSYGRWLPLMLADRIGVVEGIGEDLSEGKVPNIWSEKGMGAEWQHNRKAVVTNLIIAAAAMAVVAGTVYALSKKNELRRA